jgi:nitroimidazol reductase NimA-like FMN-containing flavoprotein (pyridoxamine 5'-phosphate oxidase superfamily)
MGRLTADRLDQEAIDAFLADQSTGMLSLASGDDSYAVPVAFTYAAETRNFHFRLGYGPGSTKREYVDATDRATFVVADDTDDGWKSVLARGELSHRSTVENADTARPADGTTSQAERERDIPYYQVFDAPGEMVFTLVRLSTDEFTGVVEATD